MSELQEKLIYWDATARKKYTYVTDAEQYGVEDQWTSHADTVLAGKPWKDDCDGLASTVLDLLARDGYAPDLMYRAMVSSTGGKVVDHMIGICSDSTTLYVVGDTFGPTYSLKKIQHRIIAVSRVSDGIKWSKVVHEDLIRKAS